MIEKADRMAAGIAVSARSAAAKVRPFDLRDNLIETLVGRVREAGKPGALQVQEVLGELLQPARVNDEAADR